MDATTLQSRIFLGYGKAALRLGYLSSVYRPSTASNPITSGNLIASIYASFNAEDMKYGKPNKYGHPTWYGVFDGSNVRVGDYLTNTNDGTYFVAAMQQALPILLVQTNRTINVLRSAAQSGVGALGYGGDTVATETALMTAWPASVLQGAKGEKNPVGLPMDERIPWVQVLLPAWAGVNIRTSDILTDDLGRRMIVSSSELTDFGWRLTAAVSQT